MRFQAPAAVGLTIEHIECSLDLTYNWGYESTRRDLRDLYTKAKRSQWISEDTLPWHLAVDPAAPTTPEFTIPIFGSDIYNRMTPKEKETVRVEVGAWTLSQFLHGEQGAMLAATQLVATVPDYDSKRYAATQVMDEARHVEVYERYLHEKLCVSYPINQHLKRLLDMILKDSRWDMKLLGMQIMVEGLALAGFGALREFTTEPLLKKLIQYVMLDEARHVAYGVLSLRDFYRDMGETDRREREDFVYEAAVLMRDRFRFEEVYEKMGLPVAACVESSLQNPGYKLFQQLLFSKIVPALKKMDLLTPRQRSRFADLGILQFEDWADPYESLKAEDEAPRALA
ncbi:MAG TPA: ferritin-like domain-containing protein [Polyangiaceae bacterium]|nr:ferritin-like domain-containing protein [Polyangiaceae bacterium]